MSKKVGGNKTMLRMLLSILFGAFVFMMLCLLLSYGIQKEWLPMEVRRAAALVSLIISTAAVAAVGRGVRVSFVLGGLYSLLYLIWRIASCGVSEMGLETGIGVLICVLCTAIFSCIFHKRTHKNTKRYHRIRR